MFAASAHTVFGPRDTIRDTVWNPFLQHRGMTRPAPAENQHFPVVCQPRMPAHRWYGSRLSAPAIGGYSASQMSRADHCGRFATTGRTTPSEVRPYGPTALRTAIAAVPIPDTVDPLLLRLLDEIAEHLIFRMRGGGRMTRNARADAES